MFEFRPELVDADDEEADDTHYIQGAGEDEVKQLQEQYVHVGEKSPPQFKHPVVKCTC